MYALKDKVTEKLYRFLPDAPSQPHESIRKTEVLKPLQSDPVRWSSKDLASLRSEYNKAECISREECRDSANNSCVEQKISTSTSTCASEMYDDAVAPRSPLKLMPNLTTDSSFIYVEFDFSLKHGILLRTLIRKSADLSGPCLMIVGDRKGAVFGGLLDCPLKPCPKKKYQETIQSFVFTNRYGEPRLFRATGANRYFYLCLNDFLAFGGGGNFALALDGDLLPDWLEAADHVIPSRNACLAHDSQFELKNVEVESKNVELWGFAHISQG